MCLLISTAAGQDQADRPILIEQKIVKVILDPENRDGIDWDLARIYLSGRQTTTGSFPLTERAYNRLDFRPMRKNVPPGAASNDDFETVEETRVEEFDFNYIWDDRRDYAKVDSDSLFGSLRIFKFKNVMDYLRSLGKAEILFNRKWVVENGEQSMLSSQPEATVTSSRGRGGGEVMEWEGSRITIKPEIIEGHRVSFRLDSEVATSFFVDPVTHPGLVVLERDGEKLARLWRLFRLSTMGVVESGQTAVFEDIREGKGILIFITPYILEMHRKHLRP